MCEVVQKKCILNRLIELCEPHWITVQPGALPRAAVLITAAATEYQWTALLVANSAMTAHSHLNAFLQATDQLEAEQRRVLASILEQHAASAYLQHIGVTGDSSAEHYRSNVPLVDFEPLREWVEQIAAGTPGVLTCDRVVAMFKTSGSTALPKHLPVTSSLMRQKVAAFAVFWEAVYRDWPAIADGTMVSNFSDASVSERSAGGLEICSESSFWARRGRSLHSLQRWPLPAELRHVVSNEARVYAMARLLLQNDLHCIMCLNPSTLLQFCRTIDTHANALIDGLTDGDWGSIDATIIDPLEQAGVSPYLRASPEAAARLGAAIDQALVSPAVTEPVDESAAGTVAAAAPAATTALAPALSLRQLWPMLDLVICWRSGLVQPYLRLLQPHLKEVATRDYITQSSECMMAIPLEDGQSGGVLAYTMHFFEFIPLAETDADAPRTLFAWELEQGEVYELVVTTGGGLYRYRMGDCVRVTGYEGQVPRIEFLHRLGKTSSITGEKLTEAHVLQAAATATASTGYEPAEFLCYPCQAAIPHYGLAIESNGITQLNDVDRTGWQAQVRSWAQAFEVALAAANGEYADKCASGRLAPIRVLGVPAGDLLRRRQQLKAAGVSENQVKSEVLSRALDVHLELPSSQWLDAAVGAAAASAPLQQSQR